MQWLARLFTPEAHGQWQLPPAAYGIIRFVDAFAPLFIRLADVESRMLKDRTRNIRIDRPIYVCGIARAGTTITLELISRHPDVGTHYYHHMPVPYLPNWWKRIEEAIPLPVMPPVERMHKDGLMVTKDSPEAVEEAFWQRFFPHLHNEAVCNALSESAENQTFEQFYTDHIRKLLYTQNRKRYAVKNNYNTTRLAYLRKVFPDARILLIVRDPVSHVASLIKQHRLFIDMETEDPRVEKTMSPVGHYEFGLNLALINTGNADTIREVRGLLAEGKSVEGWSLYWSSVYGFVADQLERSPRVAASAMVVRYEELCRNSLPTIYRILEHTGLPGAPFAETAAAFARRLSEPTYYESGFSDEEIAAIRRITAKTAGRFGYRW